MLLDIFKNGIVSHQKSFLCFKLAPNVPVFDVRIDFHLWVIFFRYASFDISTVFVTFYTLKDEKLRNSYTNLTAVLKTLHAVQFLLKSVAFLSTCGAYKLEGLDFSE